MNAPFMTNEMIKKYGLDQMTLTVTRKDGQLTFKTSPIEGAPQHLIHLVQRCMCDGAESAIIVITPETVTSSGFHTKLPSYDKLVRQTQQLFERQRASIRSTMDEMTPDLYTATAQTYADALCSGTMTYHRLGVIPTCIDHIECECGITKVREILNGCIDPPNEVLMIPGAPCEWPQAMQDELNALIQESFRKQTLSELGMIRSRNSLALELIKQDLNPNAKNEAEEQREATSPALEEVGAASAKI